MPPTDLAAPSPARRDRGQVVVIFAGAMLLFVLLAATVIDLSSYWTNNLRCSARPTRPPWPASCSCRAIPPTAYAAARAEATKNGYTTASTA